VLLTLPWTGFFVDALLRLRSWKWRDLDSLGRLRVFAFSWTIFPILFFTFSSSKLPGYILPVLPPVSILVGERIARLCANKNSSKWPVITTGLIVIVLAISGLTYTSYSGFPTMQTALLLTLPLFISGLVTIAFQHHRCLGMTVTASAVLLSLAGVLQLGATARASKESVRDLLRLADAQGYSQAAVFARRGSDRTAEFYASGRMVYDPDGEPAALDEPWQVIAEAQRRKQKILVFVPVEYLSPYRNSPQLRIIAENGSLGVVGSR